MHSNKIFVVKTEKHLHKRFITIIGRVLLKIENEKEGEMVFSILIKELKMDAYVYSWVL